MDTITLLDGTLLIGIQHALNADWLTPIMKAITYCGEGGYLWIAACIAMLLFKRTRRLGIICSLSLVITYICCNLVIKPSVDRIRPWVTFEEVTAFLPPPGDASFPSGHSANSMGPAWAMFLATCPVRIGSRKTYGETPCLGWKGSGADPRLMPNPTNGEVNVIGTTDEDHILIRKSFFCELYDLHIVSFVNF